jgi:hypothetical protein
LWHMTAKVNDKINTLSEKTPCQLWMMERAGTRMTASFIRASPLRHV